MYGIAFHLNFKNVYVLKYFVWHSYVCKTVILITANLMSHIILSKAMNGKLKNTNCFS